MSVPSLAVVAVLVAAVGIAYWGLSSGIIGYRKAAFRADLWKLRDDLVDRYFLRNPSPQPEAKDVLEAVEICIQRSADFTIFRMLSLYGFWKRAGRPKPEAKMALRNTGTCEDLDVYRERLQKIAVRYAYTSSILGPIGFLLPAVSFVVRSIAYVIRPRRHTEPPKLKTVRAVAERPLRVDLQADAWLRRSADPEWIPSV